MKNFVFVPSNLGLFVCIIALTWSVNAQYTSQIHTKMHIGHYDFEFKSPYLFICPPQDIKFEKNSNPFSKEKVFTGIFYCVPAVIKDTALLKRGKFYRRNFVDSVIQATQKMSEMQLDRLPLIKIRAKFVPDDYYESAGSILEINQVDTVYVKRNDFNIYDTISKVPFSYQLACWFKLKQKKGISSKNAQSNFNIVELECRNAQTLFDKMNMIININEQQNPLFYAYDMNQLVDIANSMTHSFKADPTRKNRTKVWIDYKIE